MTKIVEEWRNTYSRVSYWKIAYLWTSILSLSLQVRTTIVDLLFCNVLNISRKFLIMHHATLQNLQNAFADARFLFLHSSDFNSQSDVQTNFGNFLGENACLFTALRRCEQLSTVAWFLWWWPVCCTEHWEHCTRKTMTRSERCCFADLFALFA